MGVPSGRNQEITGSISQERHRKPPTRDDPARCGRVSTRYLIVIIRLPCSPAVPSHAASPWFMATRCDCLWELVEMHVDLDRVLLRAQTVPGCPAHSTVRDGEDTGLTPGAV